jgi:hypothetical protein
MHQGAICEKVGGVARFAVAPLTDAVGRGIAEVVAGKVIRNTFRWMVSSLTFVVFRGRKGMSEAFHSIHFNVAGASDLAVEATGARPLTLRAGASRTTVPNSFTDDEAAARFYLGNILQQDARPTVRGLSALDRPEVVPDLKLRDSQRSSLTNTSVVRFVQTKSGRTRRDADGSGRWWRLPSTAGRRSSGLRRRTRRGRGR